MTVQSVRNTFVPNDDSMRMRSAKKRLRMIEARELNDEYKTQLINAYVVRHGLY